MVEVGIALTALALIVLAISKSEKKEVKTYGNHCPNMGACDTCDWKDECP